MKKVLFLLTIAGVFILSSCGSGSKNKSGKDTLAGKDSTVKGTVAIASWDLYKKYNNDFQKAMDEKNVGKTFKISNLLVQFIQSGDNGSKEIDCVAFDPKNDSLTEGHTSKTTKYKLNGKDLFPVKYGYSFKFTLANPKDADGLKKFDNNDAASEVVYTYFNVVTIEGSMTEVGGNYLSFDKCKILDKK